jgi:hypothetical protein
MDKGIISLKPSITGGCGFKEPNRGPILKINSRFLYSYRDYGDSA